MTSIALPAAAPFYVTGGTLPPDAPSYVARRADEELVAALLAGDYCYVLNARQMGKSSLCVRTIDRLREAGCRTAFLDLTAIGQNLSPEQWYEGLLVSLGQQLHLEDALDDFWLEHPQLGPLQRLTQALEHVALPALGPDGRLVLFVDEIDVTRSLPFSADEFFAAIRQLYVGRATEPELVRLRFCLLGTATPADLIEDTRVSPFNIGRRIEVHDFTPAEAAPLAAGLGPGGGRLLQRVLYWTNGHPYLTQRLCRAALEQGVKGPGDVDRICRELFLTHTAREADDNLALVRNRLLKSEVDLAALLTLYGQLRAGKPVRDDETNPLCAVLKLSGVVAVAGGRLRVRNRIYDAVFDGAWVVGHLPDAELRRQRDAYRRGLARASAVAALVLAGMAGLTGWAVTEKGRADRKSREAEQSARAATAARTVADLKTAEALRESAAKTAALSREQAARSGEHAALEQAKREAAAKTAALEREQAARAAEARAAGEARGQAAHARAEQRRAMTAENIARARAHALYLSDMRRASAALEGGNTTLARELLVGRAGDPARGLEWSLLLQELHQAPATLSSGYWGWVGPEAFTPDSKRIVLPRNDRTAEVCDVETGRSLLILKGHTDRVNDAFYTSDGRRIVTASEDRTARVWDAATGRLQHLLSGHPAAVVFAAASPDDKLLVTASNDRAMRLWNAQTGQPLATLTGHTGAIWGFAFSPDGRRIATSGPDQTVRIWDAAAGRAERTLTGHTGTVDRVAWLQDNRTVVSAGADKTIRFWDVVGGTQIGVLRGHDQKVEDILLSPDGATLASASGDGTVRLWDVATQREKGPPLTGHEQGLRALAFSPDGRFLATAGLDAARVWSLADGQEIAVFKGHRYSWGSVAFSPDGRTLATASKDGTTELWDLAPRFGSGRPDSLPRGLASEGVRPQPGWFVGEWNVSAFSPDGRLLAQVEGKGLSSVVKLWDLASETEVATLRGNTGVILAAAFAPDGRTLATGSGGVTTNGAWNRAEGFVQLWEVPSGRAIATLRAPAGVLQPAFSPDGKFLASCGSDLATTLWDVAARTVVRTFSESQGVDPTLQVRALAFSPDGRLLVTASQAGTARIWEVSSGRLLHLLKGHTSGLNTVAFSPDGRTVATGSLDQTARLWDAATGRLRHTLRGHTGFVMAVAFSPDGRRLATGGHKQQSGAPDRTVRLWDPRSGVEVATLETAPGEVTNLRFSPDGKKLVAGCQNGRVRIYSAPTAQQTEAWLAQDRARLREAASR